MRCGRLRWRRNRVGRRDRHRLGRIDGRCDGLRHRRFGRRQQTLDFALRLVRIVDVLVLVGHGSAAGIGRPLLHSLLVRPDEGDRPAGRAAAGMPIGQQQPPGANAHHNHDDRGAPDAEAAPRLREIAIIRGCRIEERLLVIRGIVPRRLGDLRLDGVQSELHAQLSISASPWPVRPRGPPCPTQSRAPRPEPAPISLWSAQARRQ